MQAFLFAQFNDNQNLWRVSYERLGAKTVDDAKGLSNVIDTQAYYQGLAADKTTSGLPSLPPSTTVRDCRPTSSFLVSGMHSCACCVSFHDCVDFVLPNLVCYY